VSRRRKSKLEEFYAKYRSIIDAFKKCEEDPNSDGCKDLALRDVLDLAIYEAYRGLEVAEKVKDIISVVYSLAWVAEWNTSQNIRSKVEERLFWLKTIGVVTDLDIEHARMVAKFKRYKALFKNLPQSKVGKYVAYRLIEKLLTECEKSTEGDKLVIKIPKDKLLKLMHTDDNDFINLLEYFKDNEKVEKLYRAIISGDGSVRSENTE